MGHLVSNQYPDVHETNTEEEYLLWLPDRKEGNSQIL